ncbi:MAG: GlsB/YeaQ/YmgE family stress response membrane protein [Treponema sp.]|nr:GlsB/YeaQ/YmgE family stress response membrane protein [Treponema sp.]
MTSLVALIIQILIGAFIGWLACLFMKSAHGFWMSCLLGIVGSALGHWLAGFLRIQASGLAGFVVSVAGACLLIAIVRLVMGKKF